jgi:hypothetical protein
MQYTVTLPADYDMGIIRSRVADRGHLMDGFAGLGLKAFLIRERGVDGSPVNAYAPFYLWNDTKALGRFLWGGAGFGGIVTDFGRPTVRHWIGAGVAAGPSAQGTSQREQPETATVRRVRLPDGVDPAAAMARAGEELTRRSRTPGVHTTAIALDPHHWELVHFTLWGRGAGEGAGRGAGEDVADLAGGERYRVLHLCAPGLATLPCG